MTDADVDGSHIRTLLLTFFYRQMPELIERGHIYIGLPPLYKIKQGKQELYLKDDAALNAYLASNAVEGAELIPAEGEPPISGAALEKLLLAFAGARDAIARNAHRYDPIVLEALIDFTPLDAAHLPQNIDERHELDALEQRAQPRRPRQAALRAALQAGRRSRPARAAGHAQAHGRGARPRCCRCRRSTRGELRPLREAAAVLHGLVRDGAQIVRGSKTQPISSFAEAQAWLLDEAKKGRSIQRFKGLGEMNPEQLWETTVNPETRRLLQVRIEDAVAADQIFSTLMGDVVEPRREFIEDNALKVVQPRRLTRADRREPDAPDSQHGCAAMVPTPLSDLLQPIDVAVGGVPAGFSDRSDDTAARCRSRQACLGRCPDRTTACCEDGMPAAAASSVAQMVASTSVPLAMIG